MDWRADYRNGHYGKRVYPKYRMYVNPNGLGDDAAKGQTVNAPILPSGQESDSELASMPIEQRIESLRATIKSNAQDSISQKRA